MNNKDNTAFALATITATMIAATLIIMPSDAVAETKKQVNKPFVAGKNADVCLSKILYAEGRGESILGVIALGEATIARAKRTGTTICGVRGVTRKQPPKRLAHYWIALARTILKSNDKATSIGHSDSWNTGRRPAFKPVKGTMQHRVGHHIFYAMADL